MASIDTPSSAEVIGQVRRYIPSILTIDHLWKINAFIETSALPNLRRFLIENDKIITTCNNIIYYIVNPAMRGKTRCDHRIRHLVCP